MGAIDESLSKNTTVLIIEDDPACAYLWQRYIKKSGLHPITVETGEAAIALIARHKPLLIILDVMLPNMDGWEVLETLKADPTTDSIPVFICSALYEEDRSITAGADGYLQKPILYENFLSALSTIGMQPGNPSAIPSTNHHIDRQIIL